MQSVRPFHAIASFTVLAAFLAALVGPVWPLASPARAQTVVWTRQFGSSSGDGASGVGLDASGVYVVGGAGDALPGQTWAGGNDAFVRKYDAGGAELWTRQFGTPGTDYAFDVAVDGSGIYVVGTAGGDLPGQTRMGDVDAFVRKYDANGNELWTRQFGSNSQDQAFGVGVNASGVYVVGATGGALPGQTSAGDFDVFVRKYDASGNQQWTYQFGGFGSDWGLGGAADASGVYVVGTMGGVEDSGDAFVAKLAADAIPTPTTTPTPTTPLDTPTSTPTAIPTNSPAPSVTNTPTNTVVPSNSPTLTLTGTPTPCTEFRGRSGRCR